MKNKVIFTMLLCSFIWISSVLGSGEIEEYQKSKLNGLKSPFFERWIDDVPKGEQALYESYGMVCSRLHSSKIKTVFVEEFFRLYESGEINVDLGVPNEIILSGREKRLAIYDKQLRHNFEKYVKELENQKAFIDHYNRTLYNKKVLLVEEILTTHSHRTPVEWAQGLQFNLKYDENRVQETFRLTNDEVREIIEIVGEDDNTQVLNLSGCQSRTCMNALLKVLQNHSGIEGLIIANCNLNITTAQDLLEILEQNTDIRLIDVSGNGLSLEIVSNFERIVERNCRLMENDSEDQVLYNLFKNPGVLLDVVRDRDADIDILYSVLKSPHTDSDVLSEMTKHPKVNAGLLRKIAEHEAADVTTLLNVARNNKANRMGLEAVINNSLVNNVILIEVVDHANVRIDLLKNIVCRRDIDASVLAAIATHPKIDNVDILSFGIRSPNTSFVELQDRSSETIEKILLEIAKNPNTESGILSVVAQNPITSIGGLTAIVLNRNVDAQALAVVVEHPNANNTLFATIASRDHNCGVDDKVLLAMARNLNTDSNSLNRILENASKNAAVLAAVAVHPNADANHLFTIAGCSLTDVSGLRNILTHSRVIPDCLMEIMSRNALDAELLRRIAAHSVADADILLTVVQNHNVNQACLMAASKNRNADDRVKNVVKLKRDHFVRREETGESSGVLSPIVSQRPTVNQRSPSLMNTNISNNALAGSNLLPESNSAVQAGSLFAVTASSATQGSDLLGWFNPIGWVTSAMSYIWDLFKSSEIQKDEKSDAYVDRVILRVAGLVGLGDLRQPMLSIPLRYAELLRTLNPYDRPIDASILLAIAKHPHADVTALRGVVSHPAVDAITLAYVAAHANADSQVLYDVVMHSYTNIVGLTVAIRNPNADGLIHLQAWNHPNADNTLRDEIRYYGVEYSDKVSSERIRDYTTTFAQRWRIKKPSVEND